ncbi:insulinase family protein [Leptolyngbya sp. FACHB-16]|nr:insulinase family protein [Leptolyngbya sp. FACHB-8]MBD2158681.1 insulinase family protein [Leptolyngbya sp. FACHB-16]
MFFLAGLMVALMGLPSPVRANEALHYDQIQFPPLPEVTLPDYTRFELSNGMVVYLVEDHELPLVSGFSTIRTGARLEPANQTGLAAIIGQVMRIGGSTAHPGDVLNQLLEQRAAYIETGIDTTSGSVSFSSLTEDLDTVFTLFAEVLRQPAFPQDKIDLAKTQWQGSIARRNDEPDGIASREFNKLIYGQESPYARTVEYATLNAISRDDLVRFHQQYFHPDNMILGILGDFDSAKMRSLIETTFNNWPASAQANRARTELPPVAQAQTGGVFLVDQPQLTQSYIQIGHLGGQLDNPSHAAMSVLNEVLNGFGGRLVNEVRSRQGLAYVVYAYWSPRFDYPGLFVGGGQTRTDATVPFIQAFMSEVEKVREEPVSEAEVASAKEAVLNAFVFNFQEPYQTLSRLIRYEYYGYPDDFIFRYQKEVEAITPQDVLEAAQSQLKPEQLVTLVVGNAAGIQPSLSTIAPNGRVTPVDITIPQ